MKPPIIARVLERFPTQTALAEAVGITKSAVSQWDVVPIKHVQKVSELTGIPPQELRPDVFGFISSPASQEAVSAS